MSIFRWFAVVSASVFLAGPAAALSCLPSDVARTYTNLHNDPAKYIVAKGVLTFDESKLPVTDWDNQFDTPYKTFITGRLKGTSLSQTGFNTPFDKAITVTVLCEGPWCASGKSGEEVLAFLKTSDGAYELTLDPCHQNGFVDPTRKMLDKVMSCLRGAPCKPEDHFAQ